MPVMLDYQEIQSIGTPYILQKEFLQVLEQMLDLFLE
ncbi:MAG: hypothetical protein CM15mP102_04370 [Flavobacteriales bacterium]|nr:MAG: hypothetical protein CM15mP102_04370 [Flavobacteriales bacterium]